MARLSAQPRRTESFGSSAIGQERDLTKRATFGNSVFLEASPYIFMIVLSSLKRYKSIREFFIL